ncbi:MAG: hypothetical protein IIY70_01500 [Oscillospiraceae bacterium]|nr:hypothetical protein [Oscillospiraceae bacterium]
MKNLYRSNMWRLSKNPLFTGGMAIAFLATLAFTSNWIWRTERFTRIEHDERMFFISVAMMGFFTVFVPCFTKSEFDDGVIRNKIVAGYSMKQVFYSHLLTHFSVLVLMDAIYLIAGILGGARVHGTMLLKNVVFLFAMCGYVSALVFLAIRLKMTGASLLLLLTCYFSWIGMNWLIGFVLNGSAPAIVVTIYNVNALGQWNTNTCFGDGIANPGYAAQLAISVEVSLVMILFSTIRVNKSKIK